MLNDIVDILLPPALLGMGSLILLMTGRGTARRLGLALLTTLVLLGMPLASDSMLALITPRTAIDNLLPVPQAVVILSAEGVRLTTSTPDLEPGPMTLERLRAGASLARRINLPILVTGGNAGSAQTALGPMMANSLRDDFKTPATWVEDKSADTWQNAFYSAAILRNSGITHIYLVTHGWHLKRALVAFRAAGLDPVPVAVHPVLYNLSWHDLIPSASSWYRSYLAIHEMVGLTYYTWRASQ